MLYLFYSKLDVAISSATYLKQLQNNIKNVSVSAPHQNIKQLRSYIGLLTIHGKYICPTDQHQALGFEPPGYTFHIAWSDNLSFLMAEHHYTYGCVKWSENV